MKSGYIVIQEWMLDLELSASEMMAYAVIYGFSQDGESCFTGSQKHLARWMRCSERTVRYALAALVEKGVVEKIEMEVNGINLPMYRAVVDCRTAAKIAAPPAKIADNNLEDNLDTPPIKKKMYPYKGYTKKEKSPSQNTTPQHAPKTPEEKSCAKKEAPPFPPPEEFRKYFNAQMDEQMALIPRVRSIVGTRKTHLLARCREYGSGAVEDVFRKAARSDFMNGRNQRGWVASIDWILLPNNFLKVLDGNYDKKLNQNQNGNYNEYSDAKSRRRGYDADATSAAEYSTTF